MALFTTLYSGSSGNCALIRSGREYLLVDMGKSCRTTLTALRRLDLAVSDCAGILVTHEHSDHVAGLDTFLKKHPLPVYSSAATLAVCEDGKTRCYVARQDYDSIAVGMPVRVNGQERTIASIARLPEKVSDDLNVYIQHAEVLQGAGWVYALQLDEGIDEGVYAAQIVTESIAPASFLWN